MTPPASPFAALAYRDYRLLWMGQSVSMIGTQMQRAALLWHLYTLTHNPALMGAIGLARMIPLVSLALVGGVVADRGDRRRLMLTCQTALAALSTLLGICTLAGRDSAWLIYAVAALTAAVIAFDNPARQSLLPTLVPRERLRNAISLNSLTMQFSSILGPALLGLIIGRWSVGWVYLLNAASFVGVVGALMAMSPTPPAGSNGDTPPPGGVAAAIDGLRFMSKSHLLLSLMLLDFAATFFASATTLLPIYASEILQVGAKGYGQLAAAPGIGALIGAAVMTLLVRVRRQGATILGAVFVYGLATIGFGLARDFWLAAVCLALTGTADMVSTVLRQTIRQLATPDGMRGRMHAISMLFFQGGPQLGEMEAGLVARALGAPFSVISGGVACCLAVGAACAWAPWLRRYRVEE